MSLFQFQNIFTDSLPGDPQEDNYPRQVHTGFYSKVEPRHPSAPVLLIHSEDVARLLNLGEEDVLSDAFLDVVSGKGVLPGSVPYAMCYGGHQFGHWAGQLGDGRAINLGEISTIEGMQTIQLKGAGLTPYSRTADGLAVLRSSIREFLCSEAMHHLHIPTTRALSLVLTGDEVLRDMLYDGHPAYEKGAVLSRVAPSFIRFGSFEIWAARKDEVKLKQLLDYTIAHHYPELVGTEACYLKLFEAVAIKTCDMVVDWQRVGFVHGVMNTDNMSILGQTIDYGPYGWLDNYDPNWTPNTTDMPGRRYRFGNQPIIAQWNLLQLANALYPLIQDLEALKSIIEGFSGQYIEKYTAMMRVKLGLMTAMESDKTLIKNIEQVLHLCNVDYTIFFRLLAKITKDMPISEMKSLLEPAFYEDEWLPEKEQLLEDVLMAYQKRIALEDTTDSLRQQQMNEVNPKYVLRNYMSQLAIEAADLGDYGLLHELFTLLKRPYEEQPQYERWFAKRPDWALEKVGCSMLSCSS
ncbi:MAG: YdiU family protein [Chitinophagales bacterium]|nr:YdiU family protein [Chitinophagales bacterium]